MSSWEKESDRLYRWRQDVIALTADLNRWAHAGLTADQRMVKKAERLCDELQDAYLDAVAKESTG